MTASDGSMFALQEHDEVEFDGGEFDGLLDKLRILHHEEMRRMREEIYFLRSSGMTASQVHKVEVADISLETVEEDEVVAQKTSQHSVPTKSYAATGENAKGWEIGKKKHVKKRHSVSSLEMINKHEAPSSLRWEGSCRSWLQRLLKHPAIDCTMSLLIVINAMVFAFEAQYKGFELAEELGFKSDVVADEMSQAAHNVWPGAQAVFPVVEMCFGIIFTVEVVLRLYAMRCKFFREGWNWLDAIVVFVWLFGKIWRSLPVNSQILRLGRLFRLLRMLRLVRRMKEFDALFLMTTAIRSSFMVLGWTVALLFVCQMLFALIVQQILFGFYFDSTVTDPVAKDAQLRVYVYFGTFTRALLSLFEMTLANWPPVCRLLMEEVSEWWMIFCLLHKLTMGFAVVGVINGVLMQETFKVAHMDDTVMVREKQRAMRTHVAKMSALFHDADTSGDGRLDLEEFREVVECYEVKVWLAAMDLDVSDVEELFTMLDTGGDGRISAEELVSGVSRLRGAARAMDLKKIHHISTSLEHGLHELSTIKPMVHAIHKKHTESMEEPDIISEVDSDNVYVTI